MMNQSYGATFGPERAVLPPAEVDPDPYSALSVGAREIVLYIECTESLYRNWLALAPVLVAAQKRLGRPVLDPFSAGSSVLGNSKTRIARSFRDLLNRAERSYDREHYPDCFYAFVEEADESYFGLLWRYSAGVFLCTHLGELVASGEVSADGKEVVRGA